MGIKKAQFKVKNGTDWDKYYFETSADQVEVLDKTGETVNLQSFLDGQIIIFDIAANGKGRDYLDYPNDFTASKLLVTKGYTLLNVYNAGMNYNLLRVTGIQHDYSTWRYRISFNTTQSEGDRMLLRFIWVKGQQEVINDTNTLNIEERN